MNYTLVFIQTFRRKKVGMRSVKYMSTDSIIGYVPKYSISTVTGKIDASVTTSGIVNTV